MIHGIKLTLETQATFVPNVTDGFRIRITASDGHNMDDNIFVYSENPPDTQGNVTSVCVGVCGVPDYENLPVGAPYEDSEDRRFRLDVVDQVFRTRSIAYQAWQAYQYEAERLVESLNATEQIEANTEVVIGVIDA